ncbi:hypothetical protein HDU84_004734 [Entophlyctis sp. JEL0112]|nr:hypothetical protein HDU84_004734 [Entophlyctis sp. JEL0112]
MVVGTLIGHYVPNAAASLSSGSIAGVSVPIFVGLLAMMTKQSFDSKVKYETLVTLLSHKSAVSTIVFSLVVNVVIAPLIMTALAWATLPDLQHERTGIILVGAARCIAMVLIWNELACGDTEWCAILVAVNALVQLFLYAPIAYFLTVVIGGGDGEMVSMWLSERIPLAGGVATRVVLRFAFNLPEWYDRKFLPFIGPFALIGLLYTILVMFVLQGNEIITHIPIALRTAVPLILYFAIVFISTLAASLFITKSPHRIAVTQSFTAAGNNFELAIAVAVATYGIDSHEAFSAVIGPLIEVPVLLSLVYAARAGEGAYNRRLAMVLGAAMHKSTIENESSTAQYRDNERVEGAEAGAAVELGFKTAV